MRVEQRTATLSSQTPSAPSAPGAPTIPTRLGYVDGLRALAALAVVVCHVCATANPHSAALATMGAYGLPAVAVFIVLSGYVLTLPVARDGWRIRDGALGFYRRRAHRLLPAYYCALAFSAICAITIISQPTATVWGITLPITWGSVLTRALLIQDFSSGAPINYVFWSIAVECHIYLLFPALVALWRRYTRLFSLGLCLLAAAALTVAARLTGIPMLYHYGAEYLFAYIGLFAMGMFSASLAVQPSTAQRALTRWHVWDALALGLLALALSAVSWPIYPQAVVFGAWTLVALTSPLAQRLLKWRPLVWIGGFSYSLYLIHAPLIQLLWQYAVHPLGLGDTATYLLLLVVGGPLIVLAAWGFWYVCERPFLNSPNSRLAGARDARKGLPSAAV